MKNSLANVQARRADIERLVDRHGIATVKGLALRLKVSEITIRRDLKILHAMGRVKWHNGLVEAIAGQGGGEQRTLAVIAQRIAAGVPNYIARYSTLFMNANSLCLQVINELAKIPVTVITNNPCATACARHEGTKIMITGGRVSTKKSVLAGSVTLNFLSSRIADVTVIGCDGISVDGGLTSSNAEAAAIDSMMVTKAKKCVICLADYRKIGATQQYHIADLGMVDVLITDSFADEAVLQQARRKGINVIQVTVW